MKCNSEPDRSNLPNYFQVFEGKLIKLKRDLQYSNRYFTNNPIQKDIKFVQKESTILIDSKTELWRARIFKENDVSKFLPCDGKPLTTSLISFLNGYYQHKKPYWGYTKVSDSLAPPSDITPDNRANPKFIPYLYTSLDIDTAIAEIRPIPGSYISIAKIIPDREFKIYDLTHHSLYSQDPYNEFYRCISNTFSTPVDGDLSDYLVTQYLAEYIKSLGFDGVKYYSAQRGFENERVVGRGSNITLFNHDKLNVVETRIIHIDKIDISYCQVLPSISK